MHSIGKTIAISVTAALVLNAIAPAFAHAATYLQGEQVNADMLVRDAYIAVTYYDSKDRERSAKGWIDAVGETTFTIRSGGGLKNKTTIAYADVLSIIMSTKSTVPAIQMNEVNRFIRDEKRRVAKAEQKAKTEVVHLTGEQVNADTLVQNAYAIVTYYENNKLKREKGWIKAIGDTAFTIQNSLLGKATIAYGKVLSVIISEDAIMSIEKMNAMERELQKIEAKAMQRFNTHNAKVRFKAPSLSNKRIIGEVVKVTQYTLLIREGRTLFEVPLSSISNFEVSLGKRRNAGKGFMTGLGLGGIVLIFAMKEDINDESEWRGFATVVTAAYILPSIVVLSTLIGVATKSDKWVEVPPQRLNLSIAPTSSKGVHAALTVNF